MGGPGAPDDLTEGPQTQLWLARTSPRSPAAIGITRHMQTPHRAVHDEQFQSRLLAVLGDLTGVVAD
jgi:hypothetical protein